MSLERFVKAQEQTYGPALAELKAGAKRGHWIWWVFPQLTGLGTSHNATYYGLADQAEAQAYLAHPVLGVRYRESVAVVYQQLCVNQRNPLSLMGSEIDVLKLATSLKLMKSVCAPEQSELKLQVGTLIEVLSV